RLSLVGWWAVAPWWVVAFVVLVGGPPPRLEQRVFGLLGPNGPLPLHLTEYTRARLLHHDDPTLVRFLDLFHHRLGLFFYRAWAESRPTVQHDRPTQDRFARYVGSFAGYASPAMRFRDAVPDHAKLFFVGHLSRSAKNAEGLASILAGYFRLPARVDQFTVGWLELPVDQRTVLGPEERPSSILGQGIVVGRRVRDAQTRFRAVLGPMRLDRYEDFLPGAQSLDRLVDWVRNYVGYEFDWEVQLVLARDEVPGIQLGVQGRLGWTTWLGARPSPTDADDLILAPERMRLRERPLAAA
ncbi:MAG: type VI secretion system baseplate subunit TssG, partial [Candidatus Rokuibacteriota bacterium]